eukprot:TRINITY_DN5152_c0_g1_i1.p1 TRINITY_DN5152_c0_g1~~TRINITY_DN5152_c0_g1_i1.p1  ORF type:complete len:499 (-),score=146.35 TRINITY_DN5152_c0_g1_i1:31-1527(-)
MDLFANFFKFHLQTKLRAIIDELLEHPNEFTLDKLLEEDDLVAEVSNSNTKLIDFLSRPESLEKLVTYLTEEPAEDADFKRKTKYPSVACEILGSDIPTVNHALLQSETLLEKLISLLDRETPIQSALVGYVSKVISALIKYDATMVFDLLKPRKDLILHVLQHIENPNVKELLLKIIATENKDALEYLADTPMVQFLIGQFDPKKDCGVHETASQVLVEIVVLLNTLHSNNPNMSTVLLNQLESEDTQSKLFGYILSEPAPTSSIENGLRVLSCLLEYHISPNYDTETTIDDLPPFLKSITSRLESLHSILKKNDKLLTLSGPIGQISPLGFHRLKVVEFFAVLAHTNYHCVCVEMMKLGVFNTCISLFFQYPWNNFLHNIIEWLIQAVLSRDNDEIKVHLTRDCKLIDQICEASRLNDEDCAKPKGTRRGYMGHITSITVGILNCAESTPAVEKILLENEAWATYLKTFQQTLIKEGRDLQSSDGNESAEILMDMR